MSNPETTAQEAVYVVIGYQGEWSSLEVWVAGVFTNKSHAVTAAEAAKQDDRSKWVKWNEWNKDFLARWKASGEKFSMEYRSDQATRFGMGPEPAFGADDTEYTVATVPMNTWGRWDYERSSEAE